MCVFFFNDTATTEIYTLSLHDALPISGTCSGVVMCDLASPACPGGTPAGIANGCWTGYCIPTADCGSPGPGDGKAAVRTPVTGTTPIPAFASKKKKYTRHTESSAMSLV